MHNHNSTYIKKIIIKKKTQKQKVTSIVQRIKSKTHITIINQNNIYIYIYILIINQRESVLTKKIVEFFFLPRKLQREKVVRFSDFSLLYGGKEREKPETRVQLSAIRVSLCLSQSLCFSLQLSVSASLRLVVFRGEGCPVQ